MGSSWLLALASLLAVFTALVHALLGGREILRPVLAAPLPRTVRHVVEVMWHMLTWHLLLLGGALAWTALRPDASWAPVIAVGGGVTTLGYAGLFFAFSWARFGDVRRLPQWTLFLPMGLLALLAAGGRVPRLPLVGDVAGLVAGLVLLALGVLHTIWAAGLPWPLPSRAELALTVVGDAKLRMPGRFATLVVAGLLVSAAIWVLGLRGFFLTKPPVGTRSVLVTWGIVAVFALRGIGGFFEAALRPSIIGTPYQRWSLRLYSPLSAALATAVGLASV